MTFIEFPKVADGISFNNRAVDTHFGKQETIDAMLRVGRLWKQKFPASTISIGQMSRKNGGPMPPHKSHRLGVDVDVRPMRNDLKNLPVVYTDRANYNRELTRELIRLVRATARVKLVLFNDPVLIAEGLCQHYAGHDNHLHFRFIY